MAHLYLDEQIADAAFTVGAVITVTGDEARHAVRVSRLRVGERTLIGNGRGVIAAGTVTDADRDRFSVLVDEVRAQDRAILRTVLVQALAKGDRDERAIEQATEFGVDEIIPWEASRSVSRWGAEKAQRGVQKWSRIVREATKQSLRPWLPEVRQPVTLAALTVRASAGTLLVLHPGGSESLSAWLQRADWQVLVDSGSPELTLVVGPEGGFSDAELRELEAAGAVVLSLGNAVLRTSSAGPAALAVLNVALGRW